MGNDSRVKIHVESPTTALQERLMAVLSDRYAKEEVHKKLGEFVNDFVPSSSGALRDSMKYTATYVTWDTPYARYQYEGEVWGPNLPIWQYNSGDKTSTITGWYSVAPKSPTGRELGVPGYWKGWTFGYTTPGTGHHWYEKAIRTKGKRAFTNRVTNVLKARARRLNRTW